LRFGLEFNSASAAARLTANQPPEARASRRALIKRPQLLIVNEAVASFDGRTQDRIRDNILAMAEEGRRACVWIANRPAQAERSNRSWLCRAADRPRERPPTGGARVVYALMGRLAEFRRTR